MDPDLTMPIAAIVALVSLLTYRPTSTISETLELIETQSGILKRSTPNAVSLSAGTDLFARCLIVMLQKPGNADPAGDFTSILQRLIAHGKMFVRQAKVAREQISSYGRKFVHDGATVLTNGGSRVVSATLKRIATEPSEGGASRKFRVIYVLPGSQYGEENNERVEPEGLRTVRELRALGIPVATIPESAIGYSLTTVDLVLVGAEAVVENGGIVSRMGTYQMGALAKASKIPFYVVCESHKFVRLFPLGQYDLPIQQHVINFNSAEDEVSPFDSEQAYMRTMAKDAIIHKRTADLAPSLTPKEANSLLAATTTCNDKIELKVVDKSCAVDYTPPHLISALISESGVHTPEAVSEQLVKFWF